MTTANLNGTLLQLDQLLVAYTALLEEAKAQLASFEIDDVTIEKITKNILEESTLKSEVFRAVANDFADSLREADVAILESWSGTKFVNVISDAVMSNIHIQIDNYIKELVHEDEFKSTIESAINSEIVSNKEVFDAYQLREFFRHEIRKITQEF